MGRTSLPSGSSRPANLSATTAAEEILCPSLVADPWRISAVHLFDRASGRSEKIPGTEGLCALISSPDGRYTSATDAATDQLLLVELRSGRRTPIAGPMSWATWSPDSQYIYFVRWGINAILRVHVPDGHEEKVLEVPFPGGSLAVYRSAGRLPHLAARAWPL